MLPVGDRVLDRDLVYRLVRSVAEALIDENAHRLSMTLRDEYRETGLSLASSSFVAVLNLLGPKYEIDVQQVSSMVLVSEKEILTISSGTFHRRRITIVVRREPFRRLCCTIRRIGLFFITGDVIVFDL